MWHEKQMPKWIEGVSDEIDYFNPDFQEIERIISEEEYDEWVPVERSEQAAVATPPSLALCAPHPTAS